jgi:hypothetical protein
MAVQEPNQHCLFIEEALKREQFSDLSLSCSYLPDHYRKLFLRTLHRYAKKALGIEGLMGSLIYMEAKF